MNQIIVVLACTVFGAGFFILGWLWGQWLAQRHIQKHLDALTAVIRALAQKRIDDQ